YTTGLELKKPVMPGRGINFKAKYWADFIQHHRYDNQDRTDHTVNALLDGLFAQHIVLRINENYKKTADPPNDELTDLEKRLRNNTKTALGLKTRKLGLEVEYQYVRDNYDTLNTLDKDENVVAPTLLFYISPKTSLFAEYKIGQIEYDVNTTNNDSEYIQVNGGLRGRLAPKLVGIIKGGYKETDYEDTRTVTERDFKGGTVYGNVIYDIKENSTLAVYGEREVVESTFQTNNYYVSKKIGAQLDFKLLQRIFVFGGGRTGSNDYPENITVGSVTDKRSDDISEANAGLRYMIGKSIVLQGSYDYRKKDSNFNAYDYKNNIYSGKISLLF
ncbi:MAG: outer membrane beta-barrel protein, partial [Elusimicrobia bacterium]|nr:outer membrane beta-barrel protein [Elusimicrobiota bacterium]